MTLVTSVLVVRPNQPPRISNMDSINKLTKIFSEFPGIGPRQAKRFVYNLLQRNREYTTDFIRVLETLHNDISLCANCYRFFVNEKQNMSLCQICRDPNRSKSELMIVARDIDLENIEKSHAFNGQYFVLGGTIPLMEEEASKKIRLNEFLETVQKHSTNLKEIILGLNANPEGEYTSLYLMKALKPLTDSHQIKISVLGRGLSTGTELEYSDTNTIKNALENRH